MVEVQIGCFLTSRDDDIETAPQRQSRGAVVIDELLPDPIVAGLSGSAS